MSVQLELSFAEGRQDGYSHWYNERLASLAALGSRMGLPLGHRAEIILKDGTRLLGKLLLSDDSLWIDTPPADRVQLRVERCTFTATEIESCIRMD